MLFREVFGHCVQPGDALHDEAVRRAGNYFGYLPLWNEECDVSQARAAIEETILSEENKLRLSHVE